MKSLFRKWRAGWRDTVILVGEFQWPILLFTIIVIGGGFYYRWLAAQLGEPVQSAGEAVYIILSATFLQASGDFPEHPFLQAFYFLMPIVGVIILAQGLADFGSLLFNRRTRSKEWEMAVASTMKNHIILVGLGHLGYRITRQLNQMGKEVAVIEQNPSVDSFRAVQELGIPVIQEDATRAIALQAANIKEAKTIVLASQHDAMNLQIALKARDINPDIEVVVRIFDEDFAQALRNQFGFHALSATEMAAPVFAASAAGADVTNPISVEGQLLSLARLTIGPKTNLAERTIGYIEDNYKLNVVLVRSNQHSEFHPRDTKELEPGDTLAVLGAPEHISRLMQDNK